MSAQTDVDYRGGLCALFHHHTAAYANKLYAVGGNAWQTLPARYNTSYPPQVADSYMRILDFTKSVADISKTVVETAVRIPDTVPRTKYGIFFATPAGALKYFAGQPEHWPVRRDNFESAPNPEGRPDLANKIWTYDAGGARWLAAADSLNGGFNEQVPAVEATYAVDDKTGKAYIVGGTSWTDYAGYNVGAPGSTSSVNMTWYPLAIPEAAAANKLNGLSVVFDPSAGSFTQLKRFAAAGDGKMVGLPASTVPFQGFYQKLMVHIEWGGKKLLVVFGGAAATAMKEAYVHDIDAGTWFYQTLTAELDVFPLPRRASCAVAAAARDGSSQNIYMFGGSDAGDGQTAYSDVYILTLPAFHWVFAGQAPAARMYHTCSMLQERYLVSYRGLPRRERSATENFPCTEAQGLLMLDMQSLEWTTKYEYADAPAPYAVPEKLYKVIGGGAGGGANVTAPRGKFSDDNLAALFAAPKASGTATGTGRPTGTPSPGNGTDHSGGGSDSSGAPVGAIAGGVVGGLAVLLLLILLAFILLRRRKAQQQQRAAAGELSAQLPQEDWARQHPPLELESPAVATAMREHYGGMSEQEKRASGMVPPPPTYNQTSDPHELGDRNDYSYGAREMDAGNYGELPGSTVPGPRPQHSGSMIGGVYDDHNVNWRAGDGGRGDYMQVNEIGG